MVNRKGESSCSKRPKREQISPKVTRVTKITQLPSAHYLTKDEQHGSRTGVGSMSSTRV
jgi:hypothetical protein